jgi:hypothetical protein
MKYAVEIYSGAIMNIPSFIKIGSVNKEGYIDIQTAWSSHKTNSGK